MITKKLVKKITCLMFAMSLLIQFNIAPVMAEQTKGIDKLYQSDEESGGSTLASYYDEYSRLVSVSAKTEDTVIFLGISGWIDYGYKSNQYSYIEDADIVVDYTYTDEGDYSIEAIRNNRDYYVEDNIYEEYYYIFLNNEYQGELTIRLKILKSGDIIATCEWF